MSTPRILNYPTSILVHRNVSKRVRRRIATDIQTLTYSLRLEAGTSEWIRSVSSMPVSFPNPAAIWYSSHVQRFCINSRDTATLSRVYVPTTSSLCPSAASTQRWLHETLNEERWCPCSLFSKSPLFHPLRMGGQHREPTQLLAALTCERGR
jgi:hypothetical protein